MVGMLIMCMVVAASCMKVILMYLSDSDQTHMAEEKEVVYIAESPMPTRTQAGPWPATERKPLGVNTARRAGKRRVKSHVRRLTVTYDPVTKGHCGYMCMLAASGVRPTKAAVQALRTQIADMVYTYYVNNWDIDGYQVRAVVQSTDYTLASYLAQLKHDMWASQMELACAASILNTPVYTSSKDSFRKTGVGAPKYVVRLQDPPLPIAEGAQSLQEHEAIEY